VETVARLIEIKPGTDAKVQAWARHINANRSAALESLEAEGVSIETWFSLSLEGKRYLLCYMRTDSLRRSQEVAAQSANPIDAYHEQFKAAAWIRGSGAVASLLVDLSLGRD